MLQAHSDVVACVTSLIAALYVLLQAKLFPQYFAVANAAIVLQLGTLAFGFPGGIARTQLITLGMSIVLMKLACSQGFSDSKLTDFKPCNPLLHNNAPSHLVQYCLLGVQCGM